MCKGCRAAATAITITAAATSTALAATAASTAAACTCCNDLKYSRVTWRVYYSDVGDVSAAFGNFGRIGTSVAAVVVAGGWTSSSGSCNAGAVAVRAENKADTYAGTSRSPATSTHSSAAFGNFGRIGTSVAAVVVAG
eukprot:18215-Heterococcus_DN1.PRE.2